MLRYIFCFICGLASTICYASIVAAQEGFAPRERLQLRLAARLASLPLSQPEPEDPELEASSEVEPIRMGGEWSLVRDRKNRSGWVRSRLLEPIGSCHDDGASQFRFIARHFGFIANDERFEKVGLRIGATRSAASRREERHLSHTELSLKMGLARYQEGTAALLFYYGANASCALLIDRTGVVAYSVNRAADGPQIERLVQQYLRRIVPEACLKVRAPIENSNGETVDDEVRAAVQCRLRLAEQSADDEPSSTLARALFSQPLERAMDRFKNIIILPYGMLAIVPFAALELPDSKARFIDKFVYTIAPAFTQIGIGKGIHAQRRHVAVRPSAIVVGNPKYGDREWRFPDLPGAEEEAKTVANMLGVQPLTGESATIKNLRNQMTKPLHSTVDVLYLASHGMASEDDVSTVAPTGKYSSFVALAGGDRLSISSIDDTGYKGSRLVVLSACLTGRGWIAESGAVGLPRLFHLRGADEVVMSLWKVDDKATQKLMTHFMSEYLKDWPSSSAATAMRSAMRAVRNSYPKPAYWAAFSVFGVGPFN